MTSCSVISTERSEIFLNPGNPSSHKNERSCHHSGDAADFLATRISAAMRTTKLDSLRGVEGEAAAAYFAVFNHLITIDDPAYLHK